MQKVDVRGPLCFFVIAPKSTKQHRPTALTTLLMANRSQGTLQRSSVVNSQLNIVSPSLAQSTTHQDIRIEYDNIDVLKLSGLNVVNSSA